MKEDKAMFVSKRSRRKYYNRVYHLDTNQILKDRELPLKKTKTKDVASQCDYRSHNSVICTCRNQAILRQKRDRRYGAYKDYFNYGEELMSQADMGIGNVKALLRKKVQRVYLQDTDDRGGESSEVSTYIIRRLRHRPKSYYATKKTSSKCVGGILGRDKGSLTKKLSPIIKTVSGCTSPRKSDNRNMEIGSNAVNRSVTSTTTQVEAMVDKEVVPYEMETNKIVKQPEERVENLQVTNTYATQIKKASSVKITRYAASEDFSSDSLIQQVYDFENPSDEVAKHNASLKDVLENKIEKQYRNYFAINSNLISRPSEEYPLPEHNSASLLKHRFEALRRGFSKKAESSKNIVSTKDNLASHPSEALGCNTNPTTLSFISQIATSYVDHDTLNTYDSETTYPNTSVQQDSLKWYKRNETDIKRKGVKEIYKLQDFKSNIERDPCRSHCTPKLPIDGSKKLAIKPDVPQGTAKEKRMFFFFKRKNKKNDKQPKKNVTTARCEVSDDLGFKIGNEGHASFTNEEEYVTEEESERALSLSDLLCEPRPSIKTIWNNGTYTTSSTAVCELMNGVYRDTGYIFRSQSELTVQSYHKPYSGNKDISFQPNIFDTWMLHNVTPNNPVQKHTSTKNRVRISNHKWFIDKSKAFSHKIEVLLISKRNKNNKKQSSEYLRIDIPKGFFVDSSDMTEDRKESNKQYHSSNERVYNIVEYKSGSDLKGDMVRNSEQGQRRKHSEVKGNRDVDPGLVQAVIQTPSVPQRDEPFQASEVCIQKLCDVVGVGIITEKDMHLKDIWQPILQYQEKSNNAPDSYSSCQKQIEYAEGYSQEYYYRHWTRFDLFSWRLSDSRFQCVSGTSKSSCVISDMAKSCPNIFHEFQALVNKRDAQRKLTCRSLYNTNRKTPWYKCSLLNRATADERMDLVPKKVVPKDSIEVFRSRKRYATSKNTNWNGTKEAETPNLLKTSKDGNDYHNPTALTAKKQKHVSLKSNNQARDKNIRKTGLINYSRSSYGILPRSALVDQTNLNSLNEMLHSLNEILQQQVSQQLEHASGSTSSNVQPCPSANLISSVSTSNSTSNGSMPLRSILRNTSLCRKLHVPCHCTPCFSSNESQTQLICPQCYNKYRKSKNQKYQKSLCACTHTTYHINSKNTPMNSGQSLAHLSGQGEPDFEAFNPLKHKIEKQTGICNSSSLTSGNAILMKMSKPITIMTSPQVSHTCTQVCRYDDLPTGSYPPAMLGSRESSLSKNPSKNPTCRYNGNYIKSSQPCNNVSGASEINRDVTEVNEIDPRMSPDLKSSVSAIFDLSLQQEKNDRDQNKSKESIKVHKKTSNSKNNKDLQLKERNREISPTVKVERKSRNGQSDAPTTSILEDIYKNSNQQEITSANAFPPDLDSTKDKSKVNIANTVDIEFQIKVAQPDKTAEVSVINNGKKSIVNDKTVAKPIKDTDNYRNDQAQTDDTAAEKNNINIRIIVKNCTTPHKKHDKEIPNIHHSVSVECCDRLRNLDLNGRSLIKDVVDLMTVEKSTSNELSEAESDISTTDLEITISDTEILSDSKNDTDTSGFINKHDKYFYKYDKSHLEGTKHRRRNNTKTLIRHLKMPRKSRRAKFGVKSIKDIIRLILTSGMSETNKMKLLDQISVDMDKDRPNTLIKPNYFIDSDSFIDYYRVENNIAKDRVAKTFITQFPSECTRSNSSSYSNISIQTESEISDNLCNVLESCCCSKPIPELIRNKTSNQTLINKRNSVSEQHCSDSNSIYSQNGGQISQPQHQVSNNHRKVYTARVNEFEDHKRKQIVDNNNTLKTNDKLFVLNTKDNKMENKNRKIKINEPSQAAYILQCNEIKKAVLEMYTERKVTTKGDCFVTKLPKYVYNTENHICNVMSNTYLYKTVL